VLTRAAAGQVQWWNADAVRMYVEHAYLGLETSYLELHGVWCCLVPSAAPWGDRLWLVFGVQFWHGCNFGTAAIGWWFAELREAAFSKSYLQIGACPNGCTVPLSSVCSLSTPY